MSCYVPTGWTTLKVTSNADDGEVNEVDGEDDDLDAFTVSLLDDFDKGIDVDKSNISQSLIF